MSSGIRIEYVGAAWCSPCRVVKPAVASLAQKYALFAEWLDYDTMDEEAQAKVQKLPTIRIYDPSGVLLEITQNHVHQLEAFLREKANPLDSALCDDF
jgi:thiol-disulfide isomerase/thioredoxin